MFNPLQTPRKRHQGAKGCSVRDPGERAALESVLRAADERTRQVVRQAPAAVGRREAVRYLDQLARQREVERLLASMSPADARTVLQARGVPRSTAFRLTKAATVRQRPDTVQGTETGDQHE